MSKDDQTIREALRKLILDSLETDKNLRLEYQMGDKFRFIRDRLLALRAHVEEDLTARDQAKAETSKMEENEVLVYVHIYNAQGLAFQSWEKLVNPAVFYEYSVNRPIYTNKAQIESFIRSRPNKVQHGFLTIALQPEAILPAPRDQAPPRDQIGNPLVKIREGSLLFRKLISFTHQEIEYTVNSEGHVVRKAESSRSS